MAPPTQDLTVAQVASVCNCSPNTVRRLAKQGRLRGYKLGARDWRFPPAEVHALRHRRVAAAPGVAHPPTRVQPRRGGQLPGWYDYDPGGQPS